MGLEWWIFADEQDATRAMSAQGDLRQAIQLMQDGDVAPAVDMLERLLAGDALDNKGRAAACVWLAEARADRAFKIRCLEQALEYDPDNRQIRQGLQQLLAAPPALGGAGPRAELDAPPAVVGIVGGLNGPASGVFVDKAGTVATTAYAVGGAEAVTVMLDAARHTPGMVVRRYPSHDLALIETSLRSQRKPSAAPASVIGPDMSFIALAYGGVKLRGALGQLSRSSAPHWLRTIIPPVQLPDAGGNPLYDENGQLLGLLTRNVDGAGNALAIKFSHIFALAEKAARERKLMPDSGYCRRCGARTRSRLFGGAHCETCGAALPGAPTAPPQAEGLAALYGENASGPCPNCGARVGDYERRCLRCGHAVGGGALAGV